MESKLDVAIVIMAAGIGSRMKSNTPKVLHSLCGKSMIEYIISESLKVSTEVHVILYHKASEIREKLESKPVIFHTQPCEVYPGTGGALMDKNKHLIDIKSEKVVVLNGDMPLITSQTIRKIASLDSSVVLSVLELENPNGYGRVKFENNKILGIVEEKDCNQEELLIKRVNAGVYAFSKTFLESNLNKLDNNNAQKEFYITDLIKIALDSKEDVKAFYGDKKEFMGVNSKFELSIAENIKLNEIRKKAMENGVIMRIPESIYIESDVEFIGECELENGVRITGKSIINNSHIKANSVIESSLIESSDVGPSAHIRPKSVIKNTHIGNFVETKAATLDGVKAGHLSYLGDCEIGSGSNVGAGVITCNYDGKKKHKTTIGKNVFIGSDCQLVAPVSMESNSMAGAGTTITKNVKSGELALSRSEQKNYKDFYFRFFKD